jgi:hypothetical protein
MSGLVEARQAAARTWLGALTIVVYEHTPTLAPLKPAGGFGIQITLELRQAVHVAKLCAGPRGECRHWHVDAAVYVGLEVRCRFAGIDDETGIPTCFRTLQHEG